MSNQHFPRRLLDDAIDRAVQEMIHADPRPGLRRRVLDRLNAPPSRMSWVPKLLVPAGALAAALFLAVLLKTPAPVFEPVSTAPPVAQAPAAPATTAAVQIQPKVQAEPPAPRVARHTASVPFTFGPRSDRVTATSITDLPAAVAVAPDTTVSDTGNTVPPIAPIIVSPITIRPLDIKEIK